MTSNCTLKNGIDIQKEYPVKRALVFESDIIF